VWPDLEVQAQAARKRAEGVDVCVLDAAVLGTAAVTWAARLYDALRVADAQGPDLILVATPPRGALSEAVSDRLSRAAAPR
jgi:L-threonylcarbamoyladenylate synthase